MAISTGTPTLKLNNLSFGEQKKKSGNAKAIVDEAWPDEDGKRNCNDIDYRPEMTEKNINLYGPDTAKEVNEIIQKRYEQHKEKWEQKHNKKVRKDLNIAVAGIIKPDFESMQGMTESEQIDYLKAHFEEVKKTVENHGFEMVAATLQVDEANPHVHYVMLDPDYKIGSKLKLKLFSELNKEVPKRLQAKGYDVKILEGYDTEKAKNMTPEEREEYKEGFKNKRKSFGRNSTKYKKDKADEKAKNIIAKAEDESQAIADDLDYKDWKLYKREQELDKRSERLSDQDKRYEEREDALIASEESLDKGWEELSNAKKKLSEGQIKLSEDKQRQEDELRQSQDELRVDREKVAQMEATAKELLKNAKYADIDFVDYLKGAFRKNPKLVESIDTLHKSYNERQDKAREEQAKLERQQEQERIRQEEMARRRAERTRQLQQYSDYIEKSQGTDYQYEG